MTGTDSGNNWKKLKRDIEQMLTKPEIVTLALYQLGGGNTPCDTEDVAVKASELAREAFAWKKYQGQINLEMVRICLSDAKKPQKGARVIGTGSKGWSLTSDGVKWAMQISENITETDLISTTLRSNEQTFGGSRLKREMNRLLGSAAFASWKGDGTIKSTDACDVLRIDSYADSHLIERKIARAIELFNKDDELLAFLESVAEVVRSNE